MSDSKKIRWYNPHDKKMHECSVQIDGEDQDIDNDILIQLQDIKKNNEKLCKDIFYLGIALYGSIQEANAFLSGWLMRSIKKSIEDDGSILSINIDSREVSSAELQTYTVNMLRDTADKIENMDLSKFDPSNAPVVRNRNDGTDLFK